MPLIQEITLLIALLLCFGIWRLWNDLKQLRYDEASQEYALEKIAKEELRACDNSGVQLEAERKHLSEIGLRHPATAAKNMRLVIWDAYFHTHDTKDVAEQVSHVQLSDDLARILVETEIIKKEIDVFECERSKHFIREIVESHKKLPRLSLVLYSNRKIRDYDNIIAEKRNCLRESYRAIVKEFERLRYLENSDAAR